MRFMVPFFAALGLLILPAQADDIIFFDDEGIFDDAAPQDSLHAVQQEWARIKYAVADKEAQLQALNSLKTRIAQQVSETPENPELLLWQGIILSTEASIIKGMSALGTVKRAKALFEQVIALNETTQAGAAHTYLGALYANVPGWPVAFGSNKKAEEHLNKALAIDADNIDNNYFMGEYYVKRGNANEAESFLNKALKAPSREGRQMADEGRRTEINGLLLRLKEK